MNLLSRQGMTASQGTIPSIFGFLPSSVCGRHANCVARQCNMSYSPNSLKWVVEGIIMGVFFIGVIKGYTIVDTDNPA